MRKINFVCALAFAFAAFCFLCMMNDSKCSMDAVLNIVFMVIMCSLSLFCLLTGESSEE